MPVVAVIAAAGAWAITGAAAAAGTLLTAGTLTLAGALEITAAVGATLGAIGAVTGDKGLMTAGMVLGGIGGIGSLAVGAGLFGADAGATTLFGDASSSLAFDNPALGASAMAGSTAAAADTGSSIVDSLGGTIAATSALPDVTGGTGVAASALKGGVAADTLSPPLTSTISDLSNIGPNAAIPAPVQPIPLTPNSALAPLAPAAPSTFAQSLTQAGAGVVPTAPSVESPGIFDTIGNFVKNDKSGLIGYGLIQAGGSLVGGLFDPLKPAQVSSLDAQTAQQQAQTGITTTQASNIKASLPVARLKQQGIINMGAY